MNGLPETLVVTRFHPGNGFAPEHPYLEHVVAPLLGPTAVLVYRRLNDIAGAGAPGRVSSARLAEAVGTRGPREEPVGRRSPLARSIERLVRSGLARWEPDGGLGVSAVVMPLGRREVDRLPGFVRSSHDAFVGELAGPD